MTMQKVMDCLHSNNISEILNLLNKAFHINDYDVNQKVAFHTGVTFTIHTKTKFELLYEPWEHELIIQRCDYVELPCIAGLFTFSSKSPFFESYSTTMIINRIMNDDSGYGELKSSTEEIASKSFIHNFEIINDQEDIIQSFPLKRHLPFIFYNGRTEIKIWGDDYGEF